MTTDRHLPPRGPSLHPLDRAARELAVAVMKWRASDGDDEAYETVAKKADRFEEELLSLALPSDPPGPVYRSERGSLAENVTRAMERREGILEERERLRAEAAAKSASICTGCLHDRRMHMEGMRDGSSVPVVLCAVGDCQCDEFGEPQ